MGIFNKQKNYTQKEVDLIVKKAKAECESVVNALKTSLAELKEQHTEQTKKLHELEKNEDNVKDALLVAIEKVREAEVDGKEFYAAQLERVRMLFEKWSKVLVQIQAKYQITDAEELNAKKFASEVEEFLINKIETKIKNKGAKVQPQLRQQGSMQPAFASDEDKYYHRQLLGRMSNQRGFIMPPKEEEEEIVLPKIIKQRLNQPQNEKPVAQEKKPQPPQFVKKEVAVKPAEPEHKSKTSSTRTEIEVETKKIEDIISSKKTDVSIESKNKESKSSGIYASMIEGYFSNKQEESVLSSDYAKQIANKKEEKKQTEKFDMKAAVRPTQSLEEILKDFDL